MTLHPGMPDIDYPDVPALAEALLIDTALPDTGWPTLHPAALYGLAGDVVRAIEPHTESDSAALLASFLVGFGAAVGPGPHAVAEGAEHPARLFVAVVGETAKARKGSSWMNVRRVLAIGDEEFFADRVKGGFGSGEVLVDEFPEEGGGDRRLLVHEPEFARILTSSAREGSVLSAIIRNAWDGHPLEARSRGRKSVAKDTHVCVLGHITREELASRLTGTDVANGFANRFLLIAARRSKRLASGGDFPDDQRTELGLTVREAVRQARNVHLMRRTPAAEALWSDLYDRMADDEPGGLLAAVIARDSAQVLRLSVTYALTDGAREVDVAHVEAAWALWGYARQTAALLFGGRSGDGDADKLLAAIREAGGTGLDRTEAHSVFARHRKADQVDAVLTRLVDAGLVKVDEVPTGGRPRVVARAVAPEKQAKEANQDPSCASFASFARPEPVQGD